MTACQNIRPAWHDLIQHGNAHFAAGRFSDALCAYDHAVELVNELLDACAVNIALLISKIATHQNRAATLARLGRVGEADTEFRNGHAFARSIVDEPRFPANLRQAACCHCRMVFSEWQVFRSEHGHRLDGEDPLLKAMGFERPGSSLQAPITFH